MGADARLLIFDYEVYRDVVAPLFLRLMCDGRADSWLFELLQPDGEEDRFRAAFAGAPNGFVPAGFRQRCAYLDAEFAVTTIFDKREGDYIGTWEKRACRHPRCPIRAICPFHLQQGEQLVAVAEEWMAWLERTVQRRCLGHGQFLGRSVDCFFYWDTLDQLGAPPDHIIRRLLERLGRRGFVIGYRGSYGTEGVHGWLSPTETKALADNLFALRLPEYEYSFAAMEGFCERGNLLEGLMAGVEFQWPSYNHPTASFEELSLSYVRTVCSLASREGKGVLWGNDVA